MQEKELKHGKVITFLLCFSIAVFALVFGANYLLEKQVRPQGGVPEASNGLILHSMTGTEDVKLAGSVLSRRIAAAFTGKETDIPGGVIPVLEVIVRGKSGEIPFIVYKDRVTGVLYSICPDGTKRLADRELLLTLLGGEGTEKIFKLAEPQDITIGERAVAPSSYKLAAETLFDSVDLESKSSSETVKVHVKDDTAPMIHGIDDRARITISFNEEEVFAGGYDEYLNAGFVPQSNGEYTVHVSCQYDYGYIDYDFILTYDYMPEFALTPISQKQGGLFILTITNCNGRDVAATASFDYTATFMERTDSVWCYIPISHTISAGYYTVTAECGKYSETWDVQITEGGFDVQYLEISEETVSTTTTDDSRSEYYAVMESSYESFDEMTYWEGTFVQPVYGTITTEYGIYRYTNGSDTPTRHAGIDIAAAEGTPIVAPAAGKVIYAGNLTMTGYTVILEHGNGLHSYFFHMSALSCSEGEILHQGDEVGLVGSTGYATGPHLHYALMIGNFSINPWDAFNGSATFYLIDSMGLANR